MHVLVSFPHALGTPGIGSTAWHQAVALAEAGVRVTVICGRVARELPEDSGITVWSSLGPVRPRLVGVDRAREWHDWFTALLVLRLKPDVVHCWPSAVIRTARSARRVGAIVVREAPSPYTPVAIQQAFAAWAQLGLRPPAGHFHNPGPRVVPLEDEEFALADLVLVGSTAARATFARAPFAVRVDVAPYGYDPDRFRPVDRPALRPPTVAFVGRCEPAKGIHVLAEAWTMARLPPDTRLLLCGDVRDDVRARLTTLFSDGRVEHMRHRSDVESVFARADVLAHPSFSEGSALVIYEAMGAGVVPLVSDASGAPSRSVGLEHRTGDASQLAAHLEHALCDASQYTKLRHAVLAEAPNWTWSMAASRLLQCYDRALTLAPPKV